MTNIRDNSSDSTTKKDREIRKEVGIRKTIENMKERGISYSGDFTVDHINDPIFSTPYTSQKEMTEICNDELFDYENGRVYCYCQLPKYHDGHHKKVEVIYWDSEGRRCEH